MVLCRASIYPADCHSLGFDGTLFLSLSSNDFIRTSSAMVFESSLCRFHTEETSAFFRFTVEFSMYVLGSRRLVSPFRSVELIDP